MRQFMDAWTNAFFLQEKPMSIKFLVLGGGGVIWFFGGGCTSIERPVAQASTCTAFGFADAQVDLALAEIEKGFSLAQQREAA